MGTRRLSKAVVLAAVGQSRRGLARRAVPRRSGLAAAGFVAGTLLLGGYLFQTIGLQYTSTSVSAFVTYLLVVLVPLLSAVALRRMPSSPTLVGVGLATVGLFLLTGKGVSLGKGELLTMGCALCFALHILVLADVAPRFDTLRLNAVQLAVVGAACLLPAGNGAIIGEHLGWAGAAGAGLIRAGISVAELRPLLPRRNADSCVMLAAIEGTRSA